MSGDMLAVKDEDLREEVETYQERAGYEHLTEATEDVLKAGLREIQSPVLTRFRERALVLGEMLATFALIFLAAGIVSSEIPYAVGLEMAIVLLVFAVSIPGFVELARIASGTNELGAALREVVRG